MGSWNATCGITQLPITEGQRVAVIPLVVKQLDFLERDTLAGGGSCDNNLIAEPLSLPLFGKYDGYGGVKLDKDQLGATYLTEVLSGMAKADRLLEHPNGVPKPLKRMTSKLFDRLLQRELLVSAPNLRKMWLEDIHETYKEASAAERKGLKHYEAQLAIDPATLPENTEYALGAMFVPEALYQSLVEVAGTEKAFGYYDEAKKKMVTHKGNRRAELVHELTLTPAQKKKLMAAVDTAAADDIAEGAPAPTDKEKAEMASLAVSFMRRYVLQLNSHNFFALEGGQQATDASLLRDDEKARALWVDFILFASAMRAMRKHWAPQAGAGSSCELYEVAQYYGATHQFMAKSLADAAREDEDE